MLEKEALDLSNIVGFDHENETAGKEQRIKKDIKHEVKTEPVDENITKGIVNVEAIDKNSKRMKMIKKQALDFSNIKIESIGENFDEKIEKQALDFSNITGFDHIEEQKIKMEVKQEFKFEPMDQNFNE